MKFQGKFSGGSFAISKALLVGAFFLAACSGQGEPSPAGSKGPVGSAVNVTCDPLIPTKCVTVTPANATYTDAFGTLRLTPFVVAGGNTLVLTGSAPNTAPNAVSRIVVLADAVPTNDFAIAADSTIVLDTGVIGAMGTVSQAASCSVPAGVTFNASLVTAGALPVAGVWPTNATCRGALVTGGSTISWQSAIAGGQAGVVIPTAAGTSYRVLFLNAAGDLVYNTGTSVSATRKQVLTDPTAANLLPNRLSDVYVTNDTTAPTFPALSATGVMTAGWSGQLLPMNNLSWLETGADLSVTGGQAILKISTGNLWASNVQNRDVLTVTGVAAMQGQNFVIAPVNAADLANRNPSRMTVTDTFTAGSSGAGYEIFHGNTISTRERELSGSVVACLHSPATLRCTTDATHNAMREDSVFVQGIVSDGALTGADVTQVFVRGTNATLGQFTEEAAVLTRDINQATYNFAFASGNNILVREANIGATGNAVTVTVDTAAAGTAAVTRAGNAITVVTSALNSLVAADEQLDGDLNDVVNAINYGRPATEQIVSGGTLRFTSVKRSTEEANNIRISFWQGTSGAFPGVLDGLTVPTTANVVTADTTTTPDTYQIRINLADNGVAITGDAASVCAAITANAQASALVNCFVVANAVMTTLDNSAAVNGQLGLPVSAVAPKAWQAENSLAQNAPAVVASLVMNAGVDGSGTAGLATPVTTLTGGTATLAGSAATVFSGAAGGGTATTVTLAGMPLVTDSARGMVVNMTGGPCAGQSRVILTNTNVAASVATVTVPWTACVPAATNTYTITGRNVGKLVSSNPRVQVGIYMDIDPTGGVAQRCLPAHLNPVDDQGGATAGFDEASRFTEICYASQMNVVEGTTTFTREALDSAGNTTGDTAIAATSAMRDTVPPFLDTNAGATPQAAASVPTFCAAAFATEPVCANPAVVKTAGNSYDTFATTIDIGGKARDFNAGVSTFNTAVVPSPSGYVYVRLTNDNGYDSYALATPFQDNLGNPIPYVNGDAASPAAADMGNFQYANIPLRAGATTNFTLRMWDQAGNSSSIQFTVNQLAANTATAPSLEIDCFVDSAPRSGAGAGVPTDCASDTKSPNPNSPANIRMGLFGDASERSTYVPPESKVLPAAPGALTAVAQFPIVGNSLAISILPGTANAQTCVDAANCAGALTCTGGVTATVVCATGVVTFTAYNAGVPAIASSTAYLSYRTGNATYVNSYTNNLVTYYKYFNNSGTWNFCTPAGNCVPAGTGPTAGTRNYVAPQAQRLVGANKMSFRGRYLALDGSPPVLFINGVSGKESAFSLHGAGATVPAAYPFGFLATANAGTAGTNTITVITGAPDDVAATAGDERLAVGDYIVLSTTNSNVTANVGLYQVTSLRTGGGAACSYTAGAGTECVQISLDRTLAQSLSVADTMSVQSEWVWATTSPLDVPNEGINSFSFLAVDALNNQRAVVFSVIRDTQPPSIVIQGLVNNQAVFSMVPEVFITDSSYFTGGVDSGGTNASTLPVSRIVVSRTDANGVGTANNNIHYGFALYGDTVTAASRATIDPVNVRYDVANEDGDGLPYVIGAGQNWQALAGAPAFAPSTVLGTARAGRYIDPVTTRPQTLSGDSSCAQTAAPLSCPAGQPLSYRIDVTAADLMGLDSNKVVNTDVIEAPVDRLLSGALGVLASNPAALNLLTDNTGLTLLTMDQLSLSGVLWNANTNLSKVIGSPRDDASSNPAAFFYVTNGSQDKFGILIGTILKDPNGDLTTGADATVVTLANVARILADNGVLDDILPILDNINIFDPRTGTGNTQPGDFSRSQTFLRNLLVDTSATSTCGTNNAGLPRTCYSTAGIIQQAFPAVQATLDFGDVIANTSAGASARMRTLAVTNLSSRISGTTLVLSAFNAVNGAGNNLGTDAAAQTNQNQSFIPVDCSDAGAGGCNVQTDCNAASAAGNLANNTVCRNPANVQPGDIVVIRGGGATGACAGVGARIWNYSTKTLLTDRGILRFDATRNFPSACYTDCVLATPCLYQITPANGPALIPVVELVDILAFGVPRNDYDSAASTAGAGAGEGDAKPGERELLSALFAVMEEGMLNAPTAGDGYTDRSLVCPGVNGAAGADPCAAATATALIDDAESLQASLDLLSELADDNDTANGTEFISRAINVVNALLRTTSTIPIPAQAAGTSFLESLFPILTTVLDDGQGRKNNIGVGAGADIGGLLTAPTTNGGGAITALGTLGTNTRRNTRLNLLLRSLWWMGQPTGAAYALDLDGDGVTGEGSPEGEYSTDRTLIAMLPLLRSVVNDPDDNPRGIVTPGVSPTLLPPGSRPSLSIAEKLLGPADLLLNDNRLSTLMGNLSALLDPGTGVSDFTAFNAAGPIDESPFSPALRLPSNPFSVNPPLLRILAELSAAQLDTNLDASITTADISPVQMLTNTLNVLLTPVGVKQATENKKSDGVTTTNTDVCSEAFFAGRTPVEIVLNIVAQLLEQAQKDPKDVDYRDRTLPDSTNFQVIANRSLMRIILDGLFDDPAITDQGGTAVVTNAANAIDDWTGNPCSGDFYNATDCTGAGTGGTVAQGLRGTNGGDRIAVPQKSLDILPELLNTVARFGFDDVLPAAPFTSIFAECPAGACPETNGYSAAGARLLSVQRLGMDLALQLDAPFQIGGGVNGIVRFEQSATREFIEALSNLDNAQAVNQILLFFARLQEDIQPLSAATSVPNPTDVSRSAAGVQALADPDGDGDPSNDGVLDDFIPLIQVIPASGQTQQILDMLRAIRGCGYDAGPPTDRDIRGGEFLKYQENLILAMLDAFSGATNPLASDGGFATTGTATCPVAAAVLPAVSRGAQGGILDSNPLGAATPSVLGTAVGGSQLVRVTPTTYRDPSKDFRALGVGTGAELCVVTSSSPFDENCAQITGRPLAGVNQPVTVNTTPNDLNLIGCFTPGPCSYRVRFLREPYNGCQAGGAIAGKGLGSRLSTFGTGGITPNGYRDSRMDFVLRSLNYLADGGNGGGFVNRLESLLSTAVKDNSSTGQQSITKTFLFGAGGTQGTDTGPIQALLNDTKARAALTSFMTLFSRMANSPADPAGGPAVIQDPRDTYPNWTAGNEWPVAPGTPALASRDTPCGPGTDTLRCEGNGVHDAVDFQLLGLKGLLQTLGDPDGLDNFACNVFNRSTVLPFPSQNDSTLSIQDGHCDDPDTFFYTISSLIEAGLIKELIPGIQIILEATNALGIGENVAAAATVPFLAEPGQRDIRTNVIRGHRTQINREASADMLQRMAFAGSNDPVAWDFTNDALFDNDAVAQGYPESYSPVDCPVAASSPFSCPGIAATSGILEGPQQILARALYQFLLEYLGENTGAGANPAGEVNDQLGIGPRRNREVAFEELLAKITGARDGPNLLNQALQILRGVAIDRRNTEASAARDAVSTAGEWSETGWTTRDIGPILSLQAGLSKRGTVDTGSPQKSAMDVIGDFLNTLIEDPTDCLPGTPGLQRDTVSAPVTVQCPVREAFGASPNFFQLAGALNPNFSGDVDSVFRDGGVTAERPLQPVFDEAVFDSLSNLFAGGANSTITGALPFVGAFLDTQLDPLVQNPPTGTVASGKYTAYDYCAPGDVNDICTNTGVPATNTVDKIADAMLADIQTLIPGTLVTPNDFGRFNPLLTDDLNRNGVLDPASAIASGTGTSSPPNDLDAACVTPGAVYLDEADNRVVNCYQAGTTVGDGSFNNDWGDCGAVGVGPCGATPACGARCVNRGGTTKVIAGVSSTIGYTATDGAVTIAQVDGIDAALIDGIADLIASEQTNRAVNNESNRTSSAREQDTFTFRAVNTRPVDPDFVQMLTSLGDLLVLSNTP